MTNSTTPPNELVHQWHKEACKDPYHGGTFFESKTLKHIATKAARWGANQELEACCEWIPEYCPWDADQLRAARRPKPPSAVAQAETLIERHEDGWVPSPAQWHTIREGLAEGRRALEALPND